ncbi:MAG: hypothetical protein KAS18_04765 [Calditrichia bacterium]|nr:hypothetical protein [Calditrichia bacterium]
MRLVKLQILIPTVLVMAFLFSDLVASETRTYSMGQSAGFLRDNSDVILFPGTLNRYNSLVQTEMRFNGGDNAYSAGVHIPLPNTDFTIGVNINRPILPVDPIGLGFFGPGNAVYVDRVTDVLFGMKLNDNDLGFRVSYGSDSFTQDSSLFDPAVDKSVSYIEIAGGLSNEKFDIGGSVILPSISNEVSDTKDELSGFGFNTTGRYFHKINKKMEFVPLGMFGMISTSLDSGGLTGAQNMDFSLMNLLIGCAINYHVDDQSLIILGVHAYGSQSLTQENDFGEFTESITTLPAVFVGGESRLASWLIGRMGVMQVFQTLTETLKPKGEKETETSTTVSNVNFSFGFGIELGNFLIDADFNEGLLFQGPNFISGQAGLDMFGKLSVTYTFGSESKEAK